MYSIMLALAFMLLAAEAENGTRLKTRSSTRINDKNRFIGVTLLKSVFVIKPISFHNINNKGIITKKC